LQEALDRTGPLGDSHPTRTELRHSLGDFWWQDGNLLKAVASLEQAAAGQSAAATGAAAPRLGAQAVRVSAQGAFGILMSGPNRGVAYGSGMFLYARLADLYQQLGRPEAVAAIAVKIRALGAEDQGALAQFLANHGQLEEAASVYKKMAEQSGDAQARGNAWQMLANLHASQENYAEAIGVMRKAIAAVETAELPEIRAQAIWMRQNLARFLQQANLSDQADQIYAQLLRETARKARGKPGPGQLFAASR
jgi:tetratricopeptide (TPR) repeat protein